MTNDIAALADTLASLTAVTADETAALLRRDRSAHELAAAKARLVAALEAQTAALARARPDWMAELDPVTRDALAAQLRTLAEVSAENAQLLRRQLDLSTDLMAAIAAEAARATGARTATYGNAGALARSDRATPITLNTRL